jgi:O-succinylbenzoic acid--CoA ligase
LAALVRGRLRSLERDARPHLPYPVVGANRVETIVALCALFELGVPALLLHPRLMSSETAALLGDAERAGPVACDDAAAIVYTSGTTGEPHAAILTHAALAASAHASAANLGWETDDCWLLCMPLARVGGLSILTRCLAARRCIALMPRFDAANLPREIAAHGVTLVSMVPTMLSRVLDAHPQWRGGERLRAIVVGGAAASVRLLERARGCGLPIVITYGLTETCSHVTATPYSERFDAAAFGAGRPLPGLDVRVVDGRIEVRGPVLMAGYRNAAPLARGAWFDTGDLGTIDERGCLYVNARRTDLIVTGGENVSPVEVEQVLEACPGVREAAVFGVDDETWGQRIAAALVTEENATVAALGAHIESRLAPHKRPRAVCYVAALPHTAGGKLDRAALASLVSTLQPFP